MDPAGKVRTFNVQAVRTKTTRALPSNPVARKRNWMPPSEYTSTVSLPQFDLQAEHANAAVYAVGWLLGAGDSPDVRHTFTVTDGNGNVWDETGRKL